MSLINVSFLSSRNQGMSPELILTKNYLRNSFGEDIAFRYFVRSELIGNHLEKMGVRDAKADFCKKIKHCVSVDRSLSGSLPDAAKSGKRILIAVSYGEQFKPVSDKECYKNYSHIIAVSPYMQKRLLEEYELGETIVITDFNSPLSCDIRDEVKKKEVKELLLKYFPQMEGKKILTFYYGGKIGNESFMQKFHIEQVLKYLDEDVFVLTNNMDILENTEYMDSAYENRIGFVNNILPHWKLLYVTDTLITNSSTMATSYASRKQPVYYMGREEASFGKYMKQNYPSLCLNSETFENDRFDMNLFLEEHEKFCAEFFYESKESACKIVRDLICQ